VRRGDLAGAVSIEKGFLVRGLVPGVFLSNQGKGENVGEEKNGAAKRREEKTKNSSGFSDNWGVF